MTRNLKIELYRVIFTFIIIVHHFQNSYDLHFMTNGYIAVDFFFILSGYFLGTSLEKPLTAFDYAKKRVQRLYPEYFVSICLSIFLYGITRGGLDIQKIIPELLLIQNSGLFTGGGYNGPCWYLSTLLVMSVCLFWLLKYEKGGSSKRFLLIAALFGYSFLLNSDSGLEYWNFNGVFYPPLIRCLSGLSLGIALFIIQDEYNKKVSNIINLVSEGISYVLIILTLLGVECFGATIIGFCGVILNGFRSKRTYETKVIKVIEKLGQLSYGAYLFHISAIQIVGVFVKFMRVDLVLLRLILSIFFAFLLAFVALKIVTFVKEWNIRTR